MVATITTSEAASDGLFTAAARVCELGRRLGEARSGIDEAGWRTLDAEQRAPPPECAPATTARSEGEEGARSTPPAADEASATSATLQPTPTPHQSVGLLAAARPLLLALFALLVFGGHVLRAFTAAMILGVIVGTYSSIYVSSSLLITLGLRAEPLPGSASRPSPVAGAERIGPREP